MFPCTFVSLCRFLVLLCFGAFHVTARAASPAHLSEFPAADRVLTEIKGTGPRDTQARQVGALRQLWHLVASLAVGRSETADETRLRQTYNLAMGAIDRPMMASFDPKDTARLGAQSPRARWVALCSLYEHDTDLREELLTKFFSPGFRTRFGRAITEGHRVQKHSAAELAQNDPNAAPQWLVDVAWYKGPAYLLALVTVVTGLAWLRGVAGELRRFGLDPSDPHRLCAGRRRYVLTPVTGIVVGSRKGFIGHTETKKYIDPTALVPTPQTRSIVTGLYHHFKVARPDGTATIVALKHHRAKIAQGQRASSVEIRREKKSHGDHLFFVNHDQGVRSSGPLRSLFRPRYGLIVSSLLLLTLVALYGKAVHDYPVNRANFPTWFDFTGSVAQRSPDLIAGWILDLPFQLLGGLAATVLAWQLLGAFRAAWFVRRGADPLVDRLDAEARAQTQAGFDLATAVRAHGTEPV
ncbi:MAG: hypothetical protein JNN01_08750 [Opitutaceae bacterium]|nr:hypothetical protein [Opitutaceae bacterium]